MKKLGVLLLTLLILNIFSFVLIQAQELGDSGLPEDWEKYQEKGEEFQEQENKSDYLKQEWIKLIEKNKVLGAIHGFFEKISIVFRILFGMPYSLSWVLFFVVVLWLLIGFKVAEIIRGWGIVSEGFSYPIGLAFSVILAQTQILKKIVEFLGKFIFSPEAWWARVIIGIFVFAFWAILYVLGSALSQYLKERKKKQKEEETDLKQKEIKKVAKGLEEGMK